MLHTDTDALVCDLAETYGVFDMRALPPALVATLSCGLRKESRIMMELSGSKNTLSETLEAIIADRLGLLVWFNTKDAQHGRNRPESILEMLQGQEKDNKSDIQTFASGEDFERAWKKLVDDING